MSAPARLSWDVVVPPEPGPEVTAVRDKDDDRWKRVGDGWSLDVPPRRNHKYVSWSWHDLMVRFGPVVDVSDEPS